MRTSNLLRSTLGLGALLVSLAATAGCGGSATVEEACTGYCEQLDSAGCEVDNCDQSCEQAEEQLDGKCEEEFIDAYDCLADEDFECVDGRPELSSSDCLEEAFDLLKCLDDEGELDGDGGSSDDDGSAF